MANERIRRAWQRLSRWRARSPQSFPHPPDPLEAAPRLPGVPPRVLASWPEWFAEHTVAWARVAHDSDVAQPFLRDLLAEAVTPFLDEVERATDQEWSQISDALARWWESATPQTRAHVEVEPRVKAWLAATGRRDDLAAFCASRWFEHGWMPTSVVDGRVLAVYPGLEDLPQELAELAPQQTQLTARVRSVRAVDGGWELEAFVRIDHVSMTQVPVVQAWLQDPDGARTSLPVPVPRPDPRANHGDLDGQRYQDFAPGGVTIRIPRTAVTGAARTLRFTLTAEGLTRSGSLSVVDRRGSARPRRPARAGEEWLEFDAEQRVLLVATSTVPAAPVAAVLDRFRLDASGLTVTGRWHGPVPATSEFRLVRDGTEDEGGEGGESPTARLHERQFEVRLSLTETRWGRADQPLAVGRYWLVATAGGQDVPVLLGPAAEEAVLDWQETPGAAADAHQVRWVSSGPERRAAVMLRAALAADERGPHHQWRLQMDALTCTEPLATDLVYLQCFTGRSASDSQLALAEEIRRTRPDLRVVWGVEDAAAWTPPGDARVLVNSAEWYRTVVTAQWLSQNGDVDRWFRIRPGQRFLATFHGYPSKSMGIGMWAGKNYTPLRIAHELGRTRDVWSMILTPDPAMDDYYRAQYDYDGPILAQGLPRDDALRSPGATRTRARTRALLGIEDHQQAVLYAPTWRDDRATDWRSAEAVLHLDIDQASAALGPDHVFLVRGHRFTRPVGSGGGAQMVDVTDHPEINDLILASDAAVLDYSSLRFDFSLTGRPMVFLVPDLADYTGSVRGFLYDYPSSAPGPLVETVEEVVEALADLPGTRARYVAEYEAFERRFNRFMDGHAAGRVARAWLV